MHNVLSKVPSSRRERASAALKTVFAQESREAALAKAKTVTGEMDPGKKLKAAANCLREGIGETTTYLLGEFSANHRIKLRANNMIERLNRESDAAPASSVASPTPAALSCSYAPASGTSPQIDDPTAATWTRPISMTTYRQRHKSHANNRPLVNLCKEAGTT